MFADLPTTSLVVPGLKGFPWGLLMSGPGKNIFVVVLSPSKPQEIGDLNVWVLGFGFVHKRAGSSAQSSESNAKQKPVGCDELVCFVP